MSVTSSCSVFPGALVHLSLHGDCGHLSSTHGVTGEQGTLSVLYRASRTPGDCTVTANSAYGTRYTVIDQSG
jgi:hypothetical protein